LEVKRLTESIDFPGTSPARLAYLFRPFISLHAPHQTPMLAAIDALEKKTRSAAKQKSLRKLRDYVLSRMEMLDYRGALAKGWDI
jgi:hypothetical protein